MATTTTPQPKRSGWGIFARTLSFLPLLGPIIQGIEAITAEAHTPGATKKQMALDSLKLATGAAGVALPEFAPEIQAANELAGGAIDLIVKGFNSTSWGSHGIPALVTIPIAPLTTQTRKEIGRG